MRLVFHTHVMVAALRSARSASRRLLLGALDREIHVLVSVPVMVEYEAVLRRPENLSAFGISVEDTRAVLDAFLAVAEPIQLRFLWRPQLINPADEMVLETAINGRADRLVTFDLRHLKKAGEEFGVRAVTPPEAWKEVQPANEKK